MNVTTSLPPAYAYVQQHGDLLTQLGATKVEATDSMTIKATYDDNSAATNASALLKDTVWGAKLVVDNQSFTMDMPVVSAGGIADLLAGVAGLDVQVLTERRPDGNSIINAVAADQQLARALQELVNEQPTPRITVNVNFAGAIEQ